jgi:hypothetical protein
MIIQQHSTKRTRLTSFPSIVINEKKTQPPQTASAAEVYAEDKAEAAQEDAEDAFKELQKARALSLKMAADAAHKAVAAVKKRVN